MTGVSNAFERHLLVAVDAVGYGRGNDQDHFALQSGLTAVLVEAAAAAKLSRDRWVKQGAGDGELAILPRDEPEPLVVDDYARQLDIRLSAQNAALPPERRIRLRMAVHFGAAMPAENGYAGQGVVAVSRLVDSPPVRAALKVAPTANIVLALSRQVFDDVVRQGHVSFSESEFTRVRIQVKEYQDEAWLKVFGKSDDTPIPGGPDGQAERGGHEPGPSRNPAAEAGHAFVQNFSDVNAPGAVFGISYGGRGGS
jgi:hypothetical protein